MHPMLWMMQILRRKQIMLQRWTGLGEYARQESQIDSRCSGEKRMRRLADGAMPVRWNKPDKQQWARENV